MKKIVVLSSSGGGTFEKILKASFERKEFEVSLLITDRTCGAQDVARRNNIPFKQVNAEELHKVLLNDSLQLVDLVVLAGYMSKVPKDLCDNFAERMINIHPSLLPKHGGLGMYGMNVHKAVIAEGDKFSGCTAHLVSEEYDEGKILGQKSLQLDSNDSPESLAKKIWELEGQLIIEVIRKLVTTGN